MYFFLLIFRLQFEDSVSRFVLVFCVVLGMQQIFLTSGVLATAWSAMVFGQYLDYPCSVPKFKEVQLNGGIFALNGEITD